MQEKYLDPLPVTHQAPRIEEVPVTGALPPQLTAAGLLADEE